MQVRVNWAFQKDQREDTSGHCQIFVGDLSNDISNTALVEAFKHCADCYEGKVMQDPATGRLAHAQLCSVLHVPQLIINV